MTVWDDTLLAKLLYVAGSPDLLIRALREAGPNLEDIVDYIERQRGD